MVGVLRRFLRSRGGIVVDGRCHAAGQSRPSPSRSKAGACWPPMPPCRDDGADLVRRRRDAGRRRDRACPRARSAAAEGDLLTPTVRASRPANGATERLAQHLRRRRRRPAQRRPRRRPKNSLSSTTVKLLRASDDAAGIAANVNTSGGGDAIVLTPTGLARPNTSYTFEVTSGVKDTAGAAFAPYESTFTTGTPAARELTDRVRTVEQPAAAGSSTPASRSARTAGSTPARSTGGSSASTSPPTARCPAGWSINTVNVNNGGSATNRTARSPASASTRRARRTNLIALGQPRPVRPWRTRPTGPARSAG